MTTPTYYLGKTADRIASAVAISVASVIAAPVALLMILPFCA